MRFFIKHIIYTLVLFSSCLLISQNSIKARVVTNTVDNFLNVKGVALNTEETYKEGYTYLLFSLKKNVNGNYSRNSQSGEFSLKPNEEIELSSLSLNIQKEDECKIYLFIRKNNVLVSKDSAVVYSAESIKKKQEEAIDESEIEIKGLVIEDVKTKPGKDFYDYFYQAYLTSGVQYPFIININEKPSIGVSSKITIIVDDKTVFEFMTKPSDEFIQMAANMALTKIRNYSIKRKILYKNKKI